MKPRTLAILKEKLVKTYRKKGKNHCLTVMDANGGRQYTGNQVAEEILNETEFGVNCMYTVMGLAVDLLSRDKLTFDQRRLKYQLWVKERLEETEKEKQAIGIETEDQLKQACGKGGKARAFKEVLSYMETH